MASKKRTPKVKIPYTKIQNRKDDGQPLNFGNYVGFFPSKFLPTDVVLTADEALTLGGVWAAISYIATSLASCEIKVLDVDAKTGKRRNASDNRVYKLLNLRPNADTTAQSLKEAWIIQTLIYGDGYLEIQRDNANRPYALYLLASAQVKPRRDMSVKDGPIVYDVTVGGQGQVARTISGDDIIHLRGISIQSYLGESIITRAARSIAIGKSADEFALSYFVNNSVLGTMLKRTGPINPKDMESLEGKFDAARKGAAKAHKSILLPQGVEVEQVVGDSQKSQLVETRKYSIEDIARWFGIPPPIIGDLGRATWANLESLYIQVVRDCLTPWANRIQQESEWKLFGTNSTMWIEINLKPLTRGDAKSRADSNQVLRRNGIINANEWREDEGWEPMEDEEAGELYVIEGNMLVLNEDNLSKPEPVVPAAPVDPNAPPEDPEAEDPEAEDPGVEARAKLVDQRRPHKFEFIRDVEGKIIGINQVAEGVDNAD